MLRTVMPFIVGLLAASSGTLAQEREVYYTGDQLFQDCSDKTFCYGYISGVIGGVIDEWVLLKSANLIAIPLPFCIPKQGVTPDEMIDVTLKFLTARPADRHYDAASLVMKGIVDAFPCRPPQ